MYNNPNQSLCRALSIGIQTTLHHPTSRNPTSLLTLVDAQHYRSPLPVALSRLANKFLSVFFFVFDGGHHFLQRLVKTLAE